jgi:quercetin dioxygenase-like cupin family protein
VTITVLSVERIDAERDGAASVRRFLNAHTVGARLVEGSAYELPPGARLEQGTSDRHEVLYVTSGRITAVYRDERHALTKGQGVYCEPGESCVLENDADTPASFYRFLVKPS